MSKAKTSSWMPKKVVRRAATNGQHATVGGEPKEAGGGVVHYKSFKAAKNSGAAALRSVYFAKAGKGTGLSRTTLLPNGDAITSIRSDVMDRALGRGEFKKAE